MYADRPSAIGSVMRLGVDAPAASTNAIESLNFSLCKVTKARGHLPNDEAALKLVCLAIRHTEKKWTRQPQYWTLALNQFAIMFEGRLPA